MRIAILVAIAVALPVGALGEPGAVDWQRRVVRCSGSGAANLKAADGNPAVARIGAEKAAKLDALRNCMAALRGVNVQSGQTVGSALQGDAALAGKVEGLVRGFKVVGPPRYFSDGGVEMDVEVSLEGGLADALLPRGGAHAAPQEGSAPGTSLVIDARGQPVAPAIAPRVLDEAGRELYGPDMLGEVGRRAGGGAAYARDLETARKDPTLAARVGDRPVVLKALRAQGSDLVVSTADAEALRGNLAFLAEGRVLILTD